MALCLIDSSVWIDWFRGRESPATATVERLVRQPEVLATTQPVLMELRFGAAPAALSRIEQVMNSLVQLDVDPAIDFHQAADLFRAVRRSGHTVRSAIDCLIASVALRHDVVLMYKDVDYERIAAVAPNLRTQMLD
ncbi:PIN domain nuclease [Allokutzneria sp. A3M-2-11 16]|uniref:type II toxin-antitoxin system VapC family toxin n=1 Tax=Allokutzneria sp. A3M-2-11 16 TaxID=2962043 RepID=UPI0020B84F8A|nr:PIN domain nuclease [Allokutzneria sp. A3M-2-11 16]MCP3800473.1 PIN domain nuclease [Allokutzneria sp. A3M-2-11 16]